MFTVKKVEKNGKIKNVKLIEQLSNIGEFLENEVITLPSTRDQTQTMFNHLTTD